MSARRDDGAIDPPLAAVRPGDPRPVAASVATLHAVPSRSGEHAVRGRAPGSIEVLAVSDATGGVATRRLACPLDRVALAEGERVLVSERTPKAIVEAVERCLEQGLRVAVDAADFPALGRALGRRVGARDLVLIGPAAPSRAAAWAFRVRDILVALTLLVLLAPFLLVVSLLVLLSSPGPVFYRAEVVGRDGRPFRWRKFRSMRPACSEDDRSWRQARYGAFMREGVGSVDGSASKKVVDASRVTRIGAILRKHSLDELPQFWDVVRGHMTLVGPRPALPYEHDLFNDWHRMRVMGIRPGLTGPWQAFGRSQVSFDEMVLMDYCYGRCRSFWLDTRLMVRTIAVMVTGEGGE